MKVSTPRKLPEPACASCNVLVVDDSAVARGLIARWLENSGDIVVKATAANGEGALAMARAFDLDVVVLDIEMPGMDGLEALPKLLAIAPHLQILMASTLTERNADISLQALELGAADYVAKPSSRGLASSSDFEAELVSKAKALAVRARALRQGGDAPRQAPGFLAATDVGRPAPGRRTNSPVVLPTPRRGGRLSPEILALGSSTGGPQALFGLLNELAKPFPLPIVITQHMPTTFTPILAKHITRLTGFEAGEAQDGESLKPGQVYVAPGDFHLEVVRDGNILRARITNDDPENFCRPAVDPMFRSIARATGDRNICVVLTGMGRDGAMGARVIHEAGGIVMAQDEASCVVWGMPRAVAEAGVAELIAPVDALASRIMAICKGRGA
jgi:two-component system, chemotaxis family, protein-glutamate methylesterase/glutaminase